MSTTNLNCPRSPKTAAEQWTFLVLPTDEAVRSITHLLLEVRNSCVVEPKNIHADVHTTSKVSARYVPADGFTVMVIQFYPPVPCCPSRRSGQQLHACFPTEKQPLHGTHHGVVGRQAPDPFPLLAVFSVSLTSTVTYKRFGKPLQQQNEHATDEPFSTPAEH